jgi:hypothetical protein
MIDRSLRLARLRVASALVEVRGRLRRVLGPLVRPLLHRIYLRVDARTASAVTALHSSQRAALDDLSEQLELARAAAVASAASARALRREHDELSRRVAELEARLATTDLTDGADGRTGSPDVTRSRPLPSG